MSTIATRHAYRLTRQSNGGGVGLYHLRLLFLTGAIMMLDAMQLQILTFAEDGIKATFDVDDTMFSVAASMLFAGMFFGSVVAGRVSDKWGRRRATLMAMLAIFLGGAGVIFSPWFSLLCVSYLVLGYGSGGLHPAAALFMEMLPTAYRLLGLILFTSFFTHGLMLRISSLMQAGGCWWRYRCPPFLSRYCATLCGMSPLGSSFATGDTTRPSRCFERSNG